MVKAKFHCHSISNMDWNEPAKIVRFHPVYGGGDENQEWSKYTPSGYLEMTITNPAAFEQFEEGAEYYITFTRAEPVIPALAQE